MKKKKFKVNTEHFINSDTKKDRYQCRFEYQWCCISGNWCNTIKQARLSLIAAADKLGIPRENYEFEEDGK